MTPYENIQYFLILSVILTPVIFLGLLGKRSYLLNNFVSLIGLGITFFNKPYQLICLIGFIIFQTVLVISYAKYRLQKNKANVFYVLIILSILPLFIVKLAISSLIGFLGVSYITFKVVQILIEIRDGLIKELSIAKFLQFLLFFPTLSSGPIDRYRRFNKDLQNPSYEKGEYTDLLYFGINRIFLGFLYKFIIAYLIHFYILYNPYLKPTNLEFMILYMYAYSMYLFFDFAGYSHFVIGVSAFFGVKIPENFNLPFKSKNMKDFWNRWHMSLSFWFRDYVYMRLVFLISKKKWIKNRYVTSAVGYLILFLLMGLWHGFELHYVVYGLYQALLMIGYEWFERNNKKHKWLPKNKFLDYVSIVITFNFICFGFLIFSGVLF